MNKDSILGKVLAGETADTHEVVAWIVSDDDHVPALQNVAKLLVRYSGRTVRLTVEEVA